MTVNQQNTSAIVGFNDTAFYSGPAGAMAGGPTFIAAVLFRPLFFNNTEQFIFNNLDVANNRGWSISVSGPQASPNLRFNVGFGGGIATPVNRLLDPLVAGHLMLVHMVAFDGSIRGYLNGGKIGEAGPSVVAPSALGPRIGISSDGQFPAPGIAVLGAAYLDDAFSGATDVPVVLNFGSCHRAMDMSLLFETPLPPGPGWTNRFSVREGAVQAGANVPPPGAPLSQQTWVASEGPVNLTRSGDLFATVYTNPVWSPGVLT